MIWWFVDFSDVEIDAYSTIPSASNPLIGIEGMSGVAFSATLSNAAAAATGNNIQQATGSNKNYKIGALYSTSGTLTAPWTATFYPTVSLTDTQQALTASGAAITLSGTIDYPPMTASDCNANTHICLVVEADTTATYVEHTAEEADNYDCQALVRTCSPDPQPSSLTSSTTFTGGQSSTIAFQLTVTNIAADAAGNDILAATGTNTNFRVNLLFSDVDMATDVDTLGLASVEGTIATSELQAAVADGSGTATLGSGSGGAATLFLPESNCQSVQYLCAILFAGTNPTFIDASTVSNPSDLKPNTTCLDISGQKTCNPGES